MRRFSEWLARHGPLPSAARRIGAALLLGSAAALAPTRADSSPASNSWLVLRMQRVTAAPAPRRQLALRPAAQVDSSGIFLDQLALSSSEAAGRAWPHIRLAAAPPFGQSIALSAAEISKLLQTQASDLGPVDCGVARVRVSRRSRSLSEAELQGLLQSALQKEFVGNQGDLQLRLKDSWTDLVVPDEPISVKIYALPLTGIGASFILRFELSSPAERLGAWQLPVEASLYEKILVARSPIGRGELLNRADVAAERRDVLALRDPLPADAARNPALELTENVPAGLPVLRRSVRLRPVIRRGAIVDAILNDGSLNISLKVQALEDGLPGQRVLVRNLASQRVFYGKVQNENTVAADL